MNQKKVSGKAIESWGRYSNGSDTKTVFLSSMIPLFCPLLVVYFWASLEFYGGSLLMPILRLYKLVQAAPGAPFGEILFSWFKNMLPKYSAHAIWILIGWITFQAVLYAFVPGK